MSDLSQLLIGIALVLISIGSVTACAPRKEKMSWLVGKPFLEPGVSILTIATFMIGIILVIAYFTNIDDATMAGAARRS